MNGQFRWVMKALLSHYWRHPWQTLFLCIGLVSGVALWSAVQIINHHAEDSYQRAQSLLGVQAQYWIRNRRDEGIPSELYIELRRQGFRQIFCTVYGEIDISPQQGIVEFEKVLSGFPGSSKVPDAMLKLGYTYYELKQYPQAKIVLQDLRTRFPNETAARLGTKRLDRIRKEGH